VDKQFNPSGAETPVFIRKQSIMSDNNTPLPSSAIRILQPSPVPPPITTSAFEVSNEA
jgi:hypothetical protein